ncbi:MAG: single-stranded DNA-binding protein [Verrucomicrobiota bacterium]
MKLEINLVGKIAQHKLVEIEGKRPFLDIHIDVVLPTAGGKEFTHWIRVKVWQEMAEKIAPLLSKGCMVAVSGRPEAHPYSRRDGNPAAELIVHADKIQVMDATEG